MDLLPKEIQDKLPKLGETEGQGKTAKIVVKLFALGSAWTWFVLEGEKQEDGDWLLFGLVENEWGQEYGEFYLSQLSAIRWTFAADYRRVPGISIPGVERDLHFSNYTIGDVIKEGEIIL